MFGGLASAHNPWEQVLFDVGAAADAFFVIESGSMRLEFTADHEEHVEEQHSVLTPEVTHQLSGLHPRYES